MKNLFICLTPLQALIAQALIHQNAPVPADLLMTCYAEADNTKFRHYFQQTAALCQTSRYVVIPKGKWHREWHLHTLLHGLSKRYHTIFAASIDNPNVQYPLSHLHFSQLEPFDDGTGNLYPDGILYHNPQSPSLKRVLLNTLHGIRYQTEDLRRLSARHHTIYPNQPNIISPTIPLTLWDTLPENMQPISSSIKILLGQPIFAHNATNTTLFDALITHIQPNFYFPHPRESYHLSHVQYINTPLIFEDYLIKQLHVHPQTEFHIYHLASTCALNVNALAHTKIHALRPNHHFFRQPSLTYLYDLMNKLNIEVQDWELPKSVSDNLK